MQENKKKFDVADRDPGERFGYFVAVIVDGARVRMGAYGECFCTGSAHMFDGTTGEQLLELVTADSDTLFFGRPMAVSADGARAGAEAYGGDAFSGSTCVLDRATDVQLLKLAATGGEACRLCVRVRRELRGRAAAGARAVGMSRGHFLWLVGGRERRLRARGRGRRQGQLAARRCVRVREGHGRAVADARGGGR